MAGQCLKTADSHSVRSDMVMILGEAAKVQLSSSPVDGHILNVSVGCVCVPVSVACVGVCPWVYGCRSVCMCEMWGQLSLSL